MNKADHHAHSLAAQARFPGMDYLEWLKWFHRVLKPMSYVEIGVESGQSLQFAKPPTRGIGIDPELKVVHSQQTWVKLFGMTSDDFFSSYDLRQVIEHDVVDFAFIDGLHTFDQALKDFINIEQYSSKNTVVAFHDIFPVIPITAERERKTIFWLGDTWKVIPILRYYRPDLKVITIPTYPSGLAIVTHLDCQSKTLREVYKTAINHFMSITAVECLNKMDTLLNVIPNETLVVADFLKEETKKLLELTEDKSICNPRLLDELNIITNDLNQSNADNQFYSVVNSYLQISPEFSRQSLLHKEIEDDQEFSVGDRRVDELMSEVILDQSQYDYLNWLERYNYRFRPREMNEKQFPLISFFQATIHLIVIARQDEDALLKKTYATLQNQRYEKWRLTVIADFQTDLEPDLASHLFWKRVDALNHKIVNELINSIIQEDSADWFGLMSAGLRFDPHSLDMIAAHIKHNPNWRLIYTDSDCIDPQDKFCEPQFRPDFNLDLLLSMPYIGEFCLAQRNALLEVGGFGIYSGAENYDLTLRIFDCFGEQVIGHIAELGYHVPKSLKVSSFDEEAGQNALLAHFQRKGIHADIAQGYQSGTFFIDYRHDVQPPVSIIIPLKGDNQLIKSCIESILSRTAYLNYELILINDHNIARPEVNVFLQELGLQERIFFINNPKKHTDPAAINLAAKRARGDYLLLLCDEMLIVQDNWLERLLGYAMRQDVGIVGCRLVLPDQKVKGTGVILGKQDTAACPVEYANLEDAGYMGRGWAAQNFSAITADCMLVSKEIFFQAGGLGEKIFPEHFYDLDLCLKVKKQGYRIVWTPYVTLCRCRDASEEKLVTDRELKSRKSFIKKWLPELANDPAYNRHLSLHQHEWMIDGDFDTPWHPDLEPLPRIIAQPPDEMGVGQYRVIGPIKELTNSGQICSFILPALSSKKWFSPYVSELVRAKPTTLFLQNAFSDFQLDDLQNYAELLPDIFRVFGQDDIVFAVPQKSSVHKNFGKDTKARVRRAISFCHRVIVTNETMAEALRDMVADIHVVPNYLERSRWGDLKPLRAERRKPRVGWAGAQQHSGDLEFILPVVEATANEIDWIFMGMCPPKLRYHVAESHNAVLFDQYPATLATLDLDLAIAPLEINRFNAAKSNLRLLEYGAVGYPVICTDIQPYQNAPVTRVPNNPNAWIEAIREHIHDLDATHAAGDQLHTWVLSNWMLDQHLDEWLQALLPG